MRLTELIARMPAVEPLVEPTPEALDAEVCEDASWQRSHTRELTPEQEEWRADLAIGRGHGDEGKLSVLRGTTPQYDLTYWEDKNDNNVACPWPGDPCSEWGDPEPRCDGLHHGWSQTLPDVRGRGLATVDFPTLARPAPGEPPVVWPAPRPPLALAADPMVVAVVEDALRVLAEPVTLDDLACLVELPMLTVVPALNHLRAEGLVAHQVTRDSSLWLWRRWPLVRRAAV